MAYKYYNEDEVILGKTMKDWCRFSVVWWHTFRWGGQDPFSGAATLQHPWDDGTDSVDNVRELLTPALLPLPLPPRAVARSLPAPSALCSRAPSPVSGQGARRRRLRVHPEARRSVRPPPSPPHKTPPSSRSRRVHCRRRMLRLRGGVRSRTAHRPIRYYAFHDIDIAPEGATLGEARALPPPPATHTTSLASKQTHSKNTRLLCTRVPGLYSNLRAPFPLSCSEREKPPRRVRPRAGAAERHGHQASVGHAEPVQPPALHERWRHQPQPRQLRLARLPHPPHPQRTPRSRSMRNRVQLQACPAMNSTCADTVVRAMARLDDHCLVIAGQKKTRV